MSPTWRQGTTLLSPPGAQSASGSSGRDEPALMTAAARAFSRAETKTEEGLVLPALQWPRTGSQQKGLLMTDQIQSQMLAAVVPAKGARWQLHEIPVLEPLPTQVLVKVCANGISYADVEQTRGELPGHFPRILGHEVAGDVVAVGAAVTTRKVGDRVGAPYLQAGCGRCEWCLRGRPIMCPNSQAISRQWNGGHASSPTAATEAASLAGEGHQALEGAVGTPKPREAMA